MFDSSRWGDSREPAAGGCLFTYSKDDSKDRIVPTSAEELEIGAGELLKQGEPVSDLVCVRECKQRDERW